MTLACAPRFVVDAGLHSRHLRGVGMQRRAVLSSQSVKAVAEARQGMVLLHPFPLCWH